MADIKYTGAKQTDALSGQLSFEQDRNRIIGRDSTSLPQLLILADGDDFVMKVAKSGHDVTTASPENLVFNSAQNLPKIATTLSGSISLNFPSVNVPASTAQTFGGFSTNSLVMPHGLGTVPAILPYIYDSVSGKYAPIANMTMIQGYTGWSLTNPQLIFTSSAMVGYRSFHWRILVDATNVTIDGDYEGGGQGGPGGFTFSATTVPSVTFKVYCLQETAN